MRGDRVRFRPESVVTIERRPSKSVARSTAIVRTESVLVADRTS